MAEDAGTLARTLRSHVAPINDAHASFDPLMQLVGDAECVLIGEATHGTHEFYRSRAQITRRLIVEKDFNAVAVEADWPSAHRTARYLQARGETNDPKAALDEFRRFPAWMWRNTDVLDFITWLRAENDPRPPERKIGFYGLDLYSLYASMEAVVTLLEKIDPEAARRARYRYSCFDHLGEDAESYGYAANFGLSPSCENAVVEQLRELQRRTAGAVEAPEPAQQDALFYAEQNARVAKNAEAYYREMFGSRVSSWNLRDRHMAETLYAVMDHLRAQTGRAKVVVWEHNSHIGDARATQMGEEGELNVGQLVRERLQDRAVLIGYSTYEGTVTAASRWGGIAERKRVRPGRADSHETLFHQVQIPAFLLRLRHLDPALKALCERRLQRAIGVVYLPHTERVSHYLHTCLPEQFDAILHFDQTRAVEPLEAAATWHTGEAPETYPSAV